MKNKRIIIAVGFCAVIFYSCNTNKKQPELSSNEIHNVINEMTNLMIHDITNPPLAARFFSYACLAGYEVVAQNDSSFHSMHGYVNSYPVIAKPDSITGYSYRLASVLAMLAVAQKMQPSGKQLITYQESFLSKCEDEGFTKDEIDASLRYAAYISKNILPYAKQDGYVKISSYPRYTPLKKDGSWYPTPPAYLPAVEPYFNTVRCFFLDSCSQFKVPPPAPFSKDEHSEFYQLLTKNYQQGADSLTVEHRNIALYWDCNPFAVDDGGHLIVGLKKISPGAHWLSITGIVCNQQKKSFDETMLIHAMVAMGLTDSFIACWDEKYRSNRIRPETAIRKLINVRWKPLLQTPPFPEYVSGHSCISSASAIILSHYIGSNISFTDTTEVRFGLPKRHFTSFQQAANEAAISRFYGGIHFMDGVKEGSLQGAEVGKWILKKMDK